MKAVIERVLPSVLLAVSIALFASCENTASSQKGPVDEPVSAGSPETPANSTRVDKGAGYPKIASAVATSVIKNLDGSTFTLNDKQGKIILVNLWATWCGPCRSEIPALVRMQEKHSSQGFEVLGLNTDDEAVEDINTFAASLNVNYPIAYADTQLQSSMLKISKFPGIPQSFLIDREGRLRGVFRGANPADVKKMEEVVAKVVGESDETEAPAAEPATPADTNAQPATDIKPASDPLPEKKMEKDGKKAPK